MIPQESMMYARLAAPFLPDEHEFIDEAFGSKQVKLVYLKEGPLNMRLTRIFGRAGWDFSLLGKHDLFYDEASKTYSVTQQGRLTVRWPINGGYCEESHYDNVGGDKMLSLGGTVAEKMMNTVKAAATDAFKRCCASMGAGLYIKGLGKNVDEDNLPNLLMKIGYIPEVKIATNKFLTQTGLKKDSPDTEIKKRLDWKRDAGFNDYDLMTLNDFMVSQYLEWSQTNG